MRFILRPWQLFFLILAGWVNRSQQEIIEYQNAQIWILMQKMDRKRILLSDDQRRILVVILSEYPFNTSRFKTTCVSALLSL